MAWGKEERRIRANCKIIDKILSKIVASDNILSYVCISDSGNGSRIKTNKDMENTALDNRYKKFININRTPLSIEEQPNKTIEQCICEKIANKIRTECHSRFLGGSIDPHISRINKIPVQDGSHVGAKDEKIPFTPVRGVHGQAYCAWLNMPYSGNLHNEKQWYTYCILVEKKGSGYLVHWSRIDHSFSEAIVAEFLLDEDLAGIANESTVINQRISLEGKLPEYLIEVGLGTDYLRIGTGASLEALVSVFRRIHHTNSYSSNAQ